LLMLQSIPMYLGLCLSRLLIFNVVKDSLDTNGVVGVFSLTLCKC